MSLYRSADLIPVGGPRALRQCRCDERAKIHTWWDRVFDTPSGWKCEWHGFWDRLAGFVIAMMALVGGLAYTVVPVCVALEKKQPLWALAYVPFVVWCGWKLVTYLKKIRKDSFKVEVVDSPYVPSNNE